MGNPQKPRTRRTQAEIGWVFRTGDLIREYPSGRCAKVVLPPENAKCIPTVTLPLGCKVGACCPVPLMESSIPVWPTYNPILTHLERVIVFNFSASNVSDVANTWRFMVEPAHLAAVPFLANDRGLTDEERQTVLCLKDGETSDLVFQFCVFARCEEGIIHGILFY